MSRNEGKSGDSKHQKKSRRREKHNEANPSRDITKKNEGFSENLLLMMMMMMMMMLLGLLKDRLVGDDCQMPGINVTNKADILKIAQYHDNFCCIGPDMLKDIGHQMETNRPRDGLHKMSNDENLHAQDILTTTMSEHIESCEDMSAFSMVVYKSYCRMNRVKHQRLKNVYPIHMVKQALSIAPYDQATYNNEGLFPSQLWDQEYLVFHASDPEKVVRLNMKDIQLADDQ